MTNKRDTKQPGINTAKRLLSSAILAFCAGTSSAIIHPPSVKEAPPIMIDKATALLNIYVNTDGLLYIAKDQHNLKFWRLSPDDSQYALVKVSDLSGFDEGLLTINMTGNLSGLMYADNLFDNPMQRLSLKADMVDATLAIPVDQTDIDVLLSSVNQLNQPVATSSLPELQELTTKKQKLYYAADQAQLILTENLAFFKNTAQAQLIETMTFNQNQQTRIEQLVNDAEAELVTLQNNVAAMLQADVDEITEQSSIIETEINRLEDREHVINDCLNQTLSNAESITKVLTAKAERLTNEDDDSLDENMVDQTENALISLSDQLELCIPDSEVLQNYDPSQMVKQAPYQVLLDEFEAYLNSLDTDIEQLYADVQAHEAAMQAGLYINEIEWMAQDLHDHVMPMVSQKFAIIDASMPAMSQTLSKSKGSNSPKGNDSSMPTEGLEKTLDMCPGETPYVSIDLGNVNLVIGTPWNDQIITDADNDIVFALAGDDCVETHAGLDGVFGGRGNDEIFLGDNHDFAHGGAGQDEIHGSAGVTYALGITVAGQDIDVEFDIGNLILGGGHNDVLFGGEIDRDQGDNLEVEPNGFTDIILGDGLLFGNPPGNDTIFGEMGIDFQFGQQGDDNLSNLISGVINIAGIDIGFGTIFWGNTGNDTIQGSTALLGDWAMGGPGMDTIMTGPGIDIVLAGTEQDFIDGGLGTDLVWGQDHDDNILGNAGWDILNGGEGNDRIDGGVGFDYIRGNNGNDTLAGGTGLDIIRGNDGNDFIRGNRGWDHANGNDGNDVIAGDEGWDILRGERGVDEITGEDGWDVILGGPQSDRLFGNDGGDLIFGGSNSEEGDMEFISGGQGTDMIFGDFGHDRIEGNDGLDFIRGDNNDAIRFFAGNDIIQGGNHFDFVMGDGGDDSIQGNDARDFLLGNEGNDQISGDEGSDFLGGNAGCDNLFGNNGLDIVAGGSEIDVILGGQHMDLLIGGSAQDIMLGEGGNDLMHGGSDIDFMNGGEGFDLVSGGDGNDHMVGGNFPDVLLGGAGDDYMNGDAHNDFMLGGFGNDRLVGGTGNDIMLGMLHNDRMAASDGNDFMLGGFGNDRLQGRAGRNFVFGNLGEDVLDGYLAGSYDTRDFLFGGFSDDYLTGNQWSQKDLRFGGPGSDTRVWNNAVVNDAEFAATWSPDTCND